MKVTNIQPKVTMAVMSTTFFTIASIAQVVTGVTYFGLRSSFYLNFYTGSRPTIP